MGPAEYVGVLRSRFWVIAALVLVGVGVAWVTTPSKPSAESQVVRFRATTSLVKGPSATIDGSAPTNLALVASLVESNVVIARSAAELQRPAAELTTDLQTSVNERAGTLLISSIDTDAARAAQEADTIAAQLVTFLVERRQQQLEPLIAATNERIATFENRIRALDAQPAPPGTFEADVQRAERDSAVRQLSANYDRLQQLTTQVASAAYEWGVVSPATALPELRTDGFSTPDSRTARAVIGLVVGLLAGLALVLVLERMNPKIRTAAQAQHAFGLPVIAEIPRQSRRSRWRGGISTFNEPHSGAAESYRGLRTALMYMPRANESEVVDRFAGGHIVLITSAAPGEGKTTVAANLAAGFAEKDGDVVVVSGDVRQPAIETLLLGRRAASARLSSKDPVDAVPTMIPRVRLVLSCDPELNPADIVDYERTIVEQARLRSQIVIVDTPPALIANDATELMHTADSIVLVARCGSTTVASARRTAELIARLRVAVVGVVLVGTRAADTADSDYYRKPRRRPERRELPVRLGDTQTQPAQVSIPRRVAPVQRVDDGGIWRPKAVIDLSVDDDSQVSSPRISTEQSIGSSRATVGDGFVSSDTGVNELRRGRREKLPLFRAGDGNGHLRDR